MPHRGNPHKSVFSAKFSYQLAQTQHPHAEDEIETLWLPERHSDSSEDIRKLVAGDQGTSIVDLYAENRGRSRRCMRMGQAARLHGQTARLDARFFSTNGYFGDDSGHKSSPRRHHGTSSFNDNDSKVRQPPPMVKVQSGATIDALMNFLEQQSGGKGAAPGYSFPHIPATRNLTIGGVLAINGHGTAIPVHGEDICTSYGSLSNRILAFTAVVTDPDGATPDRYAIREFNRGEGDDRAFLAHLGRAFLLDATLEVIDNYNMRCQSFVDIRPNVLFQAPTPESSNGHESLMTFLQRTGRAEVLWYPLSDKAWLKVWTVTKIKPHTSTAVKLPYNYPFSHNLSKSRGLFLKTVIQLWPSLTARFSRSCTDVIVANLLRSASDLWGTAKNSLLYAKETTTRLTMSGYAVHIRRVDIQEAVHDFTVKISALLKAYANNSKWPINGPVEIRVTGLDDPSTVVVGSGMVAQSPTASSLVFDNLCTKNGWDVAVWFNVLTFPGTKSSNEFFAELESWLQERFSGDRGRLMPEWSKGWGYTKSEGAWTNEEFIETVRQAVTTAHQTSDWDFYVQIMSKYDRYDLFTNSLLKRLAPQSAGVAVDSSSS